MMAASTGKVCSISIWTCLSLSKSSCPPSRKAASISCRTSSLKEASVSGGIGATTSSICSWLCVVWVHAGYAPRRVGKSGRHLRGTDHFAYLFSSLCPAFRGRVWPPLQPSNVRSLPACVWRRTPEAVGAASAVSGATDGAGAASATGSGKRFRTWGRGQLRRQARGRFASRLCHRVWAAASALSRSISSGVRLAPTPVGNYSNGRRGFSSG